ncbi:MAG: SdpI family protein [Chitinophagaceae bacterium]|nr:MAG: SdpI family protein [Chitinophagaceae bacterium]
MQSVVHSTFFNADLLVGLLFLLMGSFTKVFPPKTRKNIYGYRSFLSTRNEDTWHEANQFATQHSLKIACVLIGIGLVIGFFFRTQSNWYYLFSVGTVIIAVLNLRGETEWYLSQHFEENGERKASHGQTKSFDELSSDEPAHP